MFRSNQMVIYFTGTTRCSRRAQTYAETGNKSSSKHTSKKWAKAKKKNRNKTESGKCAKIQTNGRPPEAKRRTTKSWYKLSPHMHFNTQSSDLVSPSYASYSARIWLNVCMMGSCVELQVVVQEMDWRWWSWRILQLAQRNQRRPSHHLLRAGTDTPTSGWRWGSEQAHNSTRC